VRRGNVDRTNIFLLLNCCSDPAGSEQMSPMSTSEDSSRRINGRYRFRAGNPLDPNGGDPAELSPSTADSSPIPDTADALIAMQQRHQSRPEKPVRTDTAKVKEVLALISSLDLSAWEDQRVALTIIRHLEDYHDSVVRDLQDSADADHPQLVAWAIDADRLMRCRNLLESVDLD